MKSNWLLITTLIGFCVSRAIADDTANVLSNGDFANGKANWSGDVKDASDGDVTNITASMDTQTKASGMILTLKPHDWTKVSQVFNTRESALVFAMKYQTSADFSETLSQMGPSGSAYLTSNLSMLLGIPLQLQQQDHPHPPGMNGMTGMNVDKQPFVGIVIADLSQNLVFSKYVPFHPDPSNPQTVGVVFHQLEAHEEKTFYAFFPPGTGTITFSSLSLTKLIAGDPIPATDRPFSPAGLVPPNQ
jgi:hypothetical protein